MTIIRRNLISGICVFSALFGAAYAQELLQAGSEPWETYTEVGDAIPGFVVRAIDGTDFDIAGLRGEVAFVNFWATWCGPCKAEAPRIEQDVWQAFRDSGLQVIAIAREETEAEILPFREPGGYTFPMAPDPEREIYRQFAEAGIPRSYLVGRDGTILYQSLGYNAAEFDAMVRLIEEELAGGN